MEVQQSITRYQVTSLDCRGRYSHLFGHLGIIYILCIPQFKGEHYISAKTKHVQITTTFEEHLKDKFITLQTTDIFHPLKYRLSKIIVHSLITYLVEITIRPCLKYSIKIK